MAVYQRSKSFRGNTLTKGHAFLRMVEEAEKVLGKHLIKTACFSPYSGEWRKSLKNTGQNGPCFSVRQKISFQNLFWKAPNFCPLPWPYIGEMFLKTPEQNRFLFSIWWKNLANHKSFALSRGRILRRTSFFGTVWSKQPPFLRRVRVLLSQTVQIGGDHNVRKTASGEEPLLPRTRLVSIHQVRRSWSSFLKGLYRTTKNNTYKKDYRNDQHDLHSFIAAGRMKRAAESRHYWINLLSCPASPVMDKTHLQEENHEIQN